MVAPTELSTSAQPALSAARLAANRANAAKSTGPRTPQGKAKAAMNALKHGLTASAPTLQHEDPQTYATLEQSLLADLSPQTPLELILANRIVLLTHKLTRAAQADTHLLDSINATRTENAKRTHEQAMAHYEHTLATRHFRDPKPIEPTLTLPQPLDAPTILARFFANQSDQTNPIVRLQRYETTIERSLAKTMKEYQSLQHSRPTRQQNEPTDDASDISDLESEIPPTPPQNEPTAPPSPSEIPNLKSEIPPSQNEPTAPDAPSHNSATPTPPTTAATPNPPDPACESGCCRP